VQYAKRPDVVEATQWFEGDKTPPGANFGSPDPKDTHLQGQTWVRSPDGSPRGLRSGEFVVQHKDGHVEVLSEDAFHATYTKYRG
jgi:hypothetical protein